MADFSRVFPADYGAPPGEARIWVILRDYDAWVAPARKALLLILILAICTDMRLLGGSVSLRLYTLVTAALLAINLNRLRETFRGDAMQWLPWFAFAGSLLVGGVFAANKVMFVKQWVLLLVFFSVTVSIASTRNSGSTLRLVNLALFFGIFLAAAWGWRDLLGFFGIVPVEEPYWRPKSFFEEGNEFGQFMVLAFGYLLAALLFGPARQAGAAVFLVALLLPLLLINNSRGSYLGFAVECIALMALGLGARRHAKVRKRAVLFVSTFVLLGGISFAAMQNLQLFKDETFAEFMINRVKSFFTTRDETVNLRKQYSSVAWEQFLQNPLFGIGMGNLSGPLESAIFDESGILISGDATSSNWALDLLSETGLVGALLMGCFVGAAVRRAIRKLRRTPQGPEYAMVAGNLLAFFGMLANGISYPQIYLAGFWMNMGLLISCNMTDNSTDASLAEKGL